MENKIKVITNINKLEAHQKQEIELSIGEFLAGVMLEQTKNTEQFDIRHVQNNLKLNQ